MSDKPNVPHAPGCPNGPDGPPHEPLPCDRCGKELDDEKALMGCLLVSFDSPLMPESSPPVLLCFDCGHAAIEFMTPSVKDDPEYQMAMAMMALVVKEKATPKEAKEDD